MTIENKPVLLTDEKEIESAKRDGFGDIIAKSVELKGKTYWLADLLSLIEWRERNKER